MSPEGAIVHDYLTQRGGAERVVLSIAKSMPDSPLFTSLYAPASTFPEFQDLDILPSHLDRVAAFRRHHRLAFPLLAPSFSGLNLDFPVIICSSSGWAHGARTVGRKIVYCHTPARWLYQTERYLGDRHRWARWPVNGAAIPLRKWDRNAARSAHRYLVNSSIVRDRVAEVYGIDAEVLPPPPGIEVTGLKEPVLDLDSGFFLCVSRLLEYKNIAEVVEAFARLPNERLVVAGDGPLLASLKRSCPKNVVFTGPVSELQLRWLYDACVGVVAASHEDFGLTPLEGFAFGKPTVALRWGGYLDTVREGENGVFFDLAVPDEIAQAARALLGIDFRRDDLLAYADRFSEHRFIARLQEVVAEELVAARR